MPSTIVWDEDRATEIHFGQHRRSGKWWVTGPCIMCGLQTVEQYLPRDASEVLAVLTVDSRTRGPGHDLYTPVRELVQEYITFCSITCDVVWKAVHDGA